MPPKPSDTMLASDTVRQLEQELESAIADVIESHRKHLPVGPDQPTMHLMAKAAVSVYEAAVLHSPD